MRFKKYRGLIIGSIVCIVLVKLWLWDISKGRNDLRIIQQKDLTELRGTLSNKPTIEEEGIPITLTEYPDFKFNVDDVRRRALKSREFTTEASIGDSITLHILTYDYDTKIKKAKSLRPSEAIINYRFINPYTVQLKDKTYMTLSEANRAWEDNYGETRWMLFALFGLIVLVAAIYASLHLTGTTKRLNKWWNDLQANP